ncbi:MAG TPA: cysteine desulfurase-like protein [Pirellulaceae bacterium]|jgi:cysteine desulfurase family protein (TIGR01976 family)|nr:cysteine desulfurase-like protein [Pirellulaceae bacterium]
MDRDTFFAAFRGQFPSLSKTVEGKPAVYLDGPAGTQVSQGVIDAIASYYQECNANHAGHFATSRESDARVDAAREAFADFLNVPDPETVVFGANMTTLTFAFSRAIGRTWKRGDKVLVTRLDHDANVRPWVLAANDAGVEVLWADLRVEDATLDEEDFRQKLAMGPRLVAFTGASNASGSRNDVAALCRAAHQAGALTYVDAVHLAPHDRLHAFKWDCDFLVCSAYKFFGPHVGVLYGRRELLETLEPYKLDPAPNSLPDRWMTGTQNFAAIVGAGASVDYLASIGRAAAGDSTLSRIDALDRTFQETRAHEQALAKRFLQGLTELPAYRLWGVAEDEAWTKRVATFALTHARKPSRELAAELDRRGIFAWHGNYYALELSKRLGREPQGMLRVGFVHYTTNEEVDRLLAALHEIGR